MEFYQSDFYRPKDQLLLVHFLWELELERERKRRKRGRDAEKAERAEKAENAERRRGAGKYKERGKQEGGIQRKAGAVCGASAGGSEGLARSACTARTN